MFLVLLILVRVRNLRSVWLGTSLLGPLIQLSTLRGLGWVAWPAIDAELIWSLTGAVNGQTHPWPFQHAKHREVELASPGKPHVKHDFTVVTAFLGGHTLQFLEQEREGHTQKSV